MILAGSESRRPTSPSTRNLPSDGNFLQANRSDDSLNTDDTETVISEPAWSHVCLTLKILHSWLYGKERATTCQIVENVVVAFQDH